MIRFFDILFSFLGILFLSPVFLFLYIAIRLESKGGGFYKQLRVGRGGTDFYVYKFRSMRIGADKQGLITVGIKLYPYVINGQIKGISLDNKPSIKLFQHLVDKVQS